jgi:hypothetical protein
MQRQSNLLLTVLSTVIVVIVAIACRVSPPAEVSELIVEQLEFNLIDPINFFVEGRDDILLEITSGTAEKVDLLVSTDGGNFYEKYPLVQEGNKFSLINSYEPLETHWYIAATGFGSTTHFGTFREPNVIHKFSNLENTNVLVRNKMKELLSSGGISVYDENRDIFIASGNVMMTHYVEIVNSGQRHSSYVIQYSTALSDTGVPLKFNPANTKLFEEQSDSLTAIGYILIYSTNRGSLKELLQSPNFFSTRKDSAPFIYPY